MHIEAAKGDRYVNITKNEWEEWLDTTEFRGDWYIKPGTQGVYILPVSDHVGIALSSSLSSRGDVMGYAKGSMKMMLVSTLTGRVLNKKAQGQKYFARTKNWRRSLQKGFSRLLDAYNRASDFYEKLAYLQPGESSEDALKKPRPQPQRSAPTPAMPSERSLSPEESDYLRRLDMLRALYVAARNARQEWDMKFLESVGKQFKMRKVLSPKQISVVERMLDKYNM